MGKSCIGLVVAWRWEVAGGTMASAGILLFSGMEFAMRGRFPTGWMFPLMLLPGSLFLVSGLLKKRVSSKPASEGS
jgi:hypothetical protein